MRTLLIILTGLIICSCGEMGRGDGISAFIDSSEMKKDSVYYTCTMHPKIISKKTGVCPKCGMDLTDFVYKTISAK